MTMVTKCPSCGTAFRVSPHQLQAQHGIVRCGRCANIFDGFKSLAALQDVPPVDTLRPADAAVSPDQAAVAEVPAEPPVMEKSIVVPEAPVAASQSETAVAAHAPSPIVDVTAKPPAVEQPVAASDAARAGPPEPTIPTHAAAPVTSDPQPMTIADAFDIGQLPHRRSNSWTFGVLLLLTTLAAQGAYFYRGDIAAGVPELRPYFNTLCELLRCTVALPQRPRQISIEASDMQAVDPANPGLIVLTATLRNQATTALSYPALDVVLTNTKDHTVARRIFVPTEYLGAGKDVRAGIAPNAEVTVRLNLDSGELGAAGFRLDLLAAPVR